jgi:hypothetical protein
MFSASYGVILLHHIAQFCDCAILSIKASRDVAIWLPSASIVAVDKEGLSAYEIATEVGCDRSSVP